MFPASLFLASTLQSAPTLTVKQTALVWENNVHVCLDDNARGYTLSHTHTHTYTQGHFKSSWRQSHLVVFCEGSPPSWKSPNLKYSRPEAYKVSRVSFPDAFPLCFCVSAAVTHACSAVARWTARSVFQGSARRPGLAQGLAVFQLLCGILFFLIIILWGMTKPFLL